MEIILSTRRLKAVDRRHPWIFSGAIRRVKGQPQAGDVVALLSEGGEFLGWGMWSPKSEIRLRMLSWQDEPIDDNFWAGRLERAIRLRQPFPENEARRLINAENDYLPGLIVDQYGEWLVLQSLTAGIEARKPLIAELLNDLIRPKGIYERSDADVRPKEGLEESSGPLLGKTPPDLIEMNENGHRFWVDLKQGHKTGFYLDQRDNRALLAQWLPPGARVLNAFAYTGGFSVYALAAGAAEVTSVDSSVAALQIAEQNVHLNKLPKMTTTVGDVFEVLRHYRDANQTFDAIVLDPPKFAKSAWQVDSAARGYKDINLLAWQLLNPGGLLMTFSCSGAVDADLFRKIVFGALADAERDAQVIRQLEAPADHPVALTFPEGMYLKGLLCRVV